MLQRASLLAGPALLGLASGLGCHPADPCSAEVITSCSYDGYTMVRACDDGGTQTSPGGCTYIPSSSRRCA